MHVMANENKIPEIIKSSLENIRSIVDANTVVGDPIATDVGTTIIPISKISVGIASGGVDYNDKADRPKPQNFGGGGGTGVTLSPVGFLTVSPLGTVDFIGVEAQKDPISKVVDFVESTPELIEKLKKLFEKKEATTDFDK